MDEATTPEQVTERRLWDRVPKAGWVAFFLLAYGYVWLCVDTGPLYYVSRGVRSFPVFFRGRAFLEPFLGYPGGPVEYAAAFLSQLYYYPWLGALVLTALALLVSLGTRAVVARMASRSVRLVHFVPAMLLLVVYGGYGCFLHTCLGLLAGLAGAVAYARIAPGRLPLRPVIFVLLSMLVYYVSAGGLLLFALLCALLEAVQLRRCVLAGAYLVFGGLLPYLASVWVWDLRLTDAYWRLLPYHQDADQLLSGRLLWLYASVPAAAGVGGLMRVLAARRGAEAGEATPDWQPGALWLTSVCLLFVAAAGAVWSSLDRAVGGELRIEQHNRQGAWDGVLREAARLPPTAYGARINCLVNRALFHSGRLLHDMFAFPQKPGGLVMVPDDLSLLRVPGDAYLTLSDILLDLGHVNGAERLAYQALEILGDRPYILQRLAFINIVKGQPEAASVFLTALSRDVVHGPAAQQELEHLRMYPFREGDPAVRRARATMSVEDHVGTVILERLLWEQLQRNMANRMAYEYLVAHYLLTGQVDKIARNVDTLPGSSRVPMPPLYEEAVALYLAGGEGRSLPSGRRVSDDTMRRMRDHDSMAGGRRPQDGPVPGAVNAGYGTSYFAYRTSVLREGGSE